MKIPREMARWQWLCMVWLAAVAFVQAGAATAEPPELKKIQTMAVWRMSHPDLLELGAPAGGPDWYEPDLVCGIRDPKQYEVVRLDHEVDDSLANKAATGEIEALDRGVVQVFQQRHWTAMKTAAIGKGLPYSMDRCYGKAGIIVQIGAGTARCTMNTPCTAVDSLSVLFYLPKGGR